MERGIGKPLHNAGIDVSRRRENYLSNMMKDFPASEKVQTFRFGFTVQSIYNVSSWRFLNASGYGWIVYIFGVEHVSTKI